MQDSETWTVPVFTWLTGYARPPSFSTPYTGNWIDWPSVPDDFFSDGQAALMASSFISSLTQNDGYQPFAVFVGLWKPHLPWRAPSDYFVRNANVDYPSAHHGGEFFPPLKGGREGDRV